MRITPRSHFLWKAICLFILWWVVVQAFAVLVFNRIWLTEPDTAYRWAGQPSDFFPARWQGFASLHSRWDSGFYVWIAKDGYTSENAAFLPLYPALVRSVTLLWSGVRRSPPSVGDFISGAFIVSNFGAMGAAVSFYALARLDLDESEALLALFYLLIFPTAFFLTANYTESLFVLLSCSSFYAARRTRWIAAGVLGLFAALTRVAGLFLFVSLLVEWWEEKSWKGAIGLLLIPLAFAGYELSLRLQGLSFFVTQQQVFYRSPLNVGALLHNLDWTHLQAHPAAQANLVLDIAVGLFVVVVSMRAMRWRPSYGVFGLLCVLVPLMTGYTVSLSRYGLAAFVVPLMLARYGCRCVWLDRTYTLIAVLLLGLCTILFVQGYWAG